MHSPNRSPESVRSSSNGRGQTTPRWSNLSSPWRGRQKFDVGRNGGGTARLCGCLEGLQWDHSGFAVKAWLMPIDRRWPCNRLTQHNDQTSHNPSPLMFNPPPWVRLQQWYPSIITPEIDLLVAYVADIEAQVARGIAAFHAGKEKEVFVQGRDEDEYAQVITHYKGFDDMEWDLGEVFEIYFPNLQRGAAVISLYSFFEFELDRLCRLMNEIAPSQLQLAGIAGRGIDRAVTYLHRAHGLEVQRAGPAWQEVKNIQALRNVLAHLNGRLEGRNSENVIAYVERNAPLLRRDGTSLHIQEGYVSHALGAFVRYFEVLHGELGRASEALKAAPAA